MTAKEAVNRATALRPNPYTGELEVFLRALEMRIRDEILSEAEPKFDASSLALAPPYDIIYTLFLFAVIDYLGGDYTSYAVTSAEFNAEWLRICEKFGERSGGGKEKFKLW